MKKRFDKMENRQCPICSNPANAFHQDKNRRYYECDQCFARFCPPEYFPKSAYEKARYETHNNDVDNLGYQTFVRPIVETVKQVFTAKDKGLDYGAGPGPVISKLLRELGYDISVYDPFFHPDKELLKKQFDYIVACEVIEHFHYPLDEFQFLYNRLKPGGKIICMTSIYHSKIDFKTWHYKNDKTHLLFYHEKTLEYIKHRFGFKHLEIQGNLIVFSV
ncbi:MAG: class I SAM-dependent methyltransferase [Bacteroidales bacterium]|jgi:SAM-dependent methyltransferase|nr:class I SAM-dependent methyltransferase [Bacteroidales bacterium]